MIGGALATVAVVAIVLAISIGTAGKSSAHGCIYATIPGAVGRSSSPSAAPTPARSADGPNAGGLHRGVGADDRDRVP